MRRERSSHTLQATALVNEAYLRLTDQTRVNWQSETHFLAVAAMVMRRVLVDHARGHNRQKRHGNRQKIMLDTGLAAETPAIDILEINDLLERLGVLDGQQERIAEMRLFSQMELKQIALVLDVPLRVIQYDWRMARAWLKGQIVDGG